MLSQASTLQNLEIKSECRRNIKEISKFVPTVKKSIRLIFCLGQRMVGVCRPVLKILTLFGTKKCHF